MYRPASSKPSPNRLQPYVFTVWVVCVLLGCTDPLQLPGSPHNRLVVVLDAPPRALDPRFTVDTTSAKVSKLLFSALVRVDNSAVLPEPDLASSITPDPNSTTRWHIHLRKDVVFHDGTPLTGRDVVYTFQSVLDPALGSPYRADFDAKFRAITLDPNDSYHVIFDLERPLATFWTDLDMGIVPAHLLAQNKLQGRFPEHGWVGTGPFRYVGHDGHHTWTLRRADSSYGLKPTYEWLVIRVLSDDNARLLSILAGSADFMLNGVSPILIDTLKARTDVHVHTAPSLAFTYLGLNLRIPALANLQVRQALSLAINRQEIIQTRFHGFATPAKGILPAFHWAFDPTLPALPYDPHQAEQLLDQAGYPRDPATGFRFTLEFKLSTHRFRRGIAELIAHHWSHIGVEVKLRPYEFATFFADVQKGNFDVFLLQLPEPIEPDMYRWMLYSLATPTKQPTHTSSPYTQWDRRFWNPGWQSQLDDPLCDSWAQQTYVAGLVRQLEFFAGHNPDVGSTNRVYYANPRFDCLVDLGQQHPDRGVRKQRYAEAQHIIRRELPILPLWHEDHIALTSPRLLGVKLLPTSRLSILSSIHWDSTPETE